jgi:hypothetical protein
MRKCILIHAYLTGVEDKESRMTSELSNQQGHMIISDFELT